jgi:hypothetical protein
MAQVGARGVVKKKKKRKSSIAISVCLREGSLMTGYFPIACLKLRQLRKSLFWLMVLEF